MSDGIRDLSGIRLDKPKVAGSPESTKFPELPEAPPSKTFGTPFNAYHPVPTVQGYRDAQKENEKAADDYARIVEQRQKEQADRQSRRAEEASKIGGRQDDVKVDQSGNEGKMRKANEKDPQGSKASTEKERMMEQMNSNQGVLTPKIELMDRETYG
jgi:hypothetical protein